MATTHITSADPADKTSLAGAVNFAFKKMMQDIDGQLPAEVISYDRATNRATVRPLISRLTTDGQAVERATVASMPVLALGGGGFVITFPLEPGDRGWIEASDRDISLFLQTDAIAKPNTLRQHNFSDGRFIPDVFNGFDLPGEGAGRMVIQSRSGDVAIMLSDNEITINAPTLTVNAPMIKINGQADIIGGLTVDGVAFGYHRHTGVQTGDGTTGGPI